MNSTLNAHYPKATKNTGSEQGRRWQDFGHDGKALSGARPEVFEKHTIPPLPYTALLPTFFVGNP